LARALVRLADTLVNGFDIVELFDDLVRTCVELLDLSAAGLMLADQRNALRVMASSSEQTRLLELFELQNNEGPCLDCYRTRERVAVVDDAAQATRWPSFTAQARTHGFGPVYALPMRLRDQTIGALNLFLPRGASLPDLDLDIAQAMADVATIAILQHRARHADHQLAEQLQTALNSRIAIEQAKGVIAERAQVDMEVAFTLLRRQARDHNARLSDVAMAVASGQLPPDLVLPTPSTGSPPEELDPPVA
jgi:GAF domain-containing protein